MHADLETGRRVLVLAYQRYLEADKSWRIAQRDVAQWFPERRPRALAAIGNPGSFVRRLYEKRERARLQLDVAHAKLETAKKRLAERQKRTRRSRVLLITQVGVS